MARRIEIFGRRSNNLLFHFPVFRHTHFLKNTHRQRPTESPTNIIHRRSHHGPTHCRESTPCQNSHAHVQICLQLLAQQLRRIRHFHRRQFRLRAPHRRQNLQVLSRGANEAGRTVAQRADKQPLAFIKHRHSSATRTHLDRCAIGTLHHRFTQEARTAVGDQSITLHLTNAQTTLLSTTTRRLVGPLLTTSLATSIPLVLRHVLQAHAEDRADENRRWHLNTASAIIQNLIARLLKTKLSF